MTDKQTLDAASALRDSLNCGADIFGDVDVLDVLKNLDLRGYKITRNQDYEEEKFTGLFDTNGKKIMDGDIVFWDDESKGKWSRIAVVKWEKPILVFDVVASPYEGIIGHKFNFGNFIYEETEKYLTVVEFVGEGLKMAEELRNHAN